MPSRDKLLNSSLFGHVYFMAGDPIISKGFVQLEKSRYSGYINFY